MFCPLAALVPASSICQIISLGTGSDFRRRMERVELMTSNNPGSVMGLAHQFVPQGAAFNLNPNRLAKCDDLRVAFAYQIIIATFTGRGFHSFDELLFHPWFDGRFVNGTTTVVNFLNQ